MSATSHETAWTLVSCNYIAFQSCNSTSVTRLHILEPFHSPLRTFYVLCFWRDSPQWVRASSLTRFLDHTQRRTTVGRTPLDEWSARCRDLYLTKYNTTTHPCPLWYSNPQSQQASALDRAATGTGLLCFRTINSLNHGCLLAGTLTYVLHGVESRS